MASVHQTPATPCRRTQQILGALTDNSPVPAANGTSHAATTELVNSTGTSGNASQSNARPADVAGNDRVDEFAQIAQPGHRDHDLREFDPATPRPVFKQSLRRRETPPHRSTVASSAAAPALIMQFARKPADAGMLKC